MPARRRGGAASSSQDGEDALAIGGLVEQVVEMDGIYPPGVGGSRVRVFAALGWRSTGRSRLRHRPVEQCDKVRLVGREHGRIVIDPANPRLAHQDVAEASEPRVTPVPCGGDGLPI